jgi:hypothetical protein
MTALVFAGKQLFGFLGVIFVCWLWRFALMRGRVKLLEVKGDM